MAIAGMNESARAAAEANSRASMERLSIELRDLILAQDPRDLLGYLYAQRLMGRMFASGGPHPDGTASGEAQGDATAGELIDDTRFLLEYVHAAWASSAQLPTGAFSEADCANIWELAKELKTVSMMHCIYSSAGTQDGAFGPQTRDVEFRAKTTWIMLRGNRYQVLEEESFSFVLAPHDGALQRVYGIGAHPSTHRARTSAAVDETMLLVWLLTMTCAVRGAVGGFAEVVAAAPGPPPAAAFAVQLAEGFAVQVLWLRRWHRLGW